MMNYWYPHNRPPYPITRDGNWVTRQQNQVMCTPEDMGHQAHKDGLGSLLQQLPMTEWDPRMHSNNLTNRSCQKDCRLDHRRYRLSFLKNGHHRNIHHRLPHQILWLHGFLTSIIKDHGQH